MPSENPADFAAGAPPPEKIAATFRRLDPIDRVSEVLFGLIMVLTFTGSLSVAEAGREDVRLMLIGALGCNLAWGVIDAFLYLMGCLAEKCRDLRLYRALRDVKDPATARRLMHDALPSELASVLRPEEIESFCERLKQLPKPAPLARLGCEDLWGALGVFLWVFLSIFPVVIPFLVMSDVAPAKRTSNAVAIVLLYLTGHAYGKMTGRRPWLVGVAMVVVGILLVLFTIALGG